jgi:signal transduction histidine kinase
MKTRLLVRLTAPIMVLSILPLAGGIVAAWQVHRSQKLNSEDLARNTLSMRSAEELVIEFHNVQHKLHLFLITKDRRYLEEVPALRQGTQGTDRWLSLMEQTAMTQEERELIGRVHSGYERFFTDFEGLLQGPHADGLPDRVRELARGTLEPEILQPAQNYLDINEKEIGDNNEANQTNTERMVLALLLLGVCGPVSGLLAGYGISRAVSHSIVRLSVPIRDAAGKLNEIVGPITLAARWGLDELEGVLHTIAERIGAVIERLQQSERDARKAEHLAAVGQMAAGMAHELRNPLMPMKILVQAAAERSPSPGLDESDLAVLEQEITRLERSIQLFLDFARPPQIEKRTFEVGEMLTSLVGLLQPRAERQGVRLECRWPEQPVLIQADVGQLRQLVLNLVLNALDATGHGGTILLEMAPSAEPSEGDGPSERWLTLRVSDTGAGLPPGLGLRIFEPFVSTKETGLGLGLSICKRIVEAHGGDIQASNRPGGGAVFTIRLPCPEPAVRLLS